MSRHPAGSLMSFLADVPDPRGAMGRRHPLVAMLTHACCAMLCGCRGYAAIAQWGRDQPIEFMHRIGYRRTPASYGSFQGLLSRLDATSGRSMTTNRHSRQPSSRPSSRPFPPYGRRRQAEELDEARTLDAHGGRVERRTLATTTMLNTYLDWPGVAQVCRIEAEVSTGDEATHEVSYAITSVPRAQADAATLLGWHRGHWGIGNRLHWVRDVTMGEDQNRTRVGSGPQVLAALRNAAISHMRALGSTNIAASSRRNAAQVGGLLKVLDRLKN